MAYTQGIRLKKKYGQHFLRDARIPQHMVEAVSLDKQSSVLEIGGGDGFLTRVILREPIARLWVFEIDTDWAEYLKKNITDPRLHIFEQNFLEINAALFNKDQPWTVLSNLPYMVTFPILHWFLEQRHLLREGVVMVQEEVAQKIVKRSGRDYGFISLFFQYYFEWKLLDKIPPEAFEPPPKVFSRLLYFKPKSHLEAIINQEDFWQFIKACFKQPRRKLKNNLSNGQYNAMNIPEDILQLRAQQMTMQDFLILWNRFLSTQE